MITLSYMAHEWRHANKQQLTKYAGGIKSTILKYPVRGTAKDLAIAFVSGHTVVLGELGYTEEELKAVKSDPGKKLPSASSRHWKSQQVFALDFDNKDEEKPLSKTDPRYIEPTEAIDIATREGVPPAFVYTTYSHSDECSKFRMVFVTDELITDINERQRFLAGLFEVFTIDGYCRVDTQCSDPARLFYPGRSLIHVDYERTIPKALVLEIKPTFSIGVPTKAVKRLGITYQGETHNLDSRILSLITEGHSGSSRKVQDLISELFRQAPKPWNNLIREVSDKGHTISLSIYSIIYYKKIIKAYCVHPIEDDLTSSLSTVLADIPNPDILKAMKKRVHIDTPEEYYKAVSRFPWHILFEKRLCTHFNCILPNHVDTNASARFEETADGEYIYHCYGCQQVNRYYDIFNLLEKVTGWSHKQSKEFVNELLNLEFETEWQKEKKEEITSFQDFLRTNTFKERFTYLRKELIDSRAFAVYDVMLGEARRKILDRLATQSDDPIFFTSLRRLGQLMKENGVTEGISTRSLNLKLKYLIRLGLINALEDKDIPSETVGISNKMRIEKGYRYRISMYAIPQLGMNLLVSAEENARELKESRVKRKDASVQSEIWRNDGDNEVFVQDADVDRSPETIEFYEKCLLAAEDLMSKGYFTEKEILAHRRIRKFKKKKELSAIVMPQLLKDKKLKFVKYNEKYKALFGISQETLKKGRSLIIIPEKDVIV